MGSIASSGASEPRSWYSPHRAIVFLAVVLTAIAVAGGTLGVVNASRAERATAQLTRQYLVLQPPVREIRASVAAFQVLAAEAFSSPTPATSLVTQAVADSNSTDRAYLTLQHLLALPGNGDLAPHLTTQMAAYVAARSNLGAFLAGEPQTAETAHLAAVELSADAGLDATLGALQSTITDRLTQTADQAQSAAHTGRVDLLWSIVIGVILAAAITAFLAGHALQVERGLSHREEVQSEISRRTEFEARLQRALEMSKSEQPVFDLVVEALDDAAPNMRSELHRHQCLVRRLSVRHPARDDSVPDTAGRSSPYYSNILVMVLLASWLDRTGRVAQSRANGDGTRRVGVDSAHRGGSVPPRAPVGDHHSKTMVDNHDRPPRTAGHPGPTGTSAIIVLAEECTTVVNYPGDVHPNTDSDPSP